MSDFEYVLLMLLVLWSWLLFEIPILWALFSAAAAFGVEFCLQRYLRRDENDDAPPLLRRDRPPPVFHSDEYGRVTVVG